MTTIGSTITDKTVFGDRRTHVGTWTSSGAVVGNVNTGLKSCDAMFFNNFTTIGAGVTASGAFLSGVKLNQSDGIVEILCTQTGLSGQWIAYGK